MLILSFADLGKSPSYGETVGYIDWACPGDGVVVGVNGKWIEIKDSLSGEIKKFPKNKVYPIDQEDQF